MRYTQVTVTRNETTSIVIHVGAWEVPILESVHGNERLLIGESKDFKNRPWPDNAAGEMERLNKLYGRTGDGDSAPSHAEAVYGAGSRGIKALEAAIAEAKAKYEKPKRGRPPKVAEDLVAEDLVGEASA